MKKSIAATVLACLLSACTTVYGPMGFTGGYSDEKIDDQTYRVKFSGNGHTSSDMVWNYWIYHCAELTKEKGYSAFTLSIKDRRVSEGLPVLQKAGLAAQGRGDARMVPVKGGGGVGSYYYVPGYTVTTYRADAILKMYKLPYPADAEFLLEPQKIIDALKPYVESAGKEKSPSRKDVLQRAFIPPSVYL